MTTADPLGDSLEEVVHACGHILPAQAPIETFVHHNTLHAFQTLPFHEAVREASAILDTEPYLTEETYRGYFKKGRIRAVDVDEALTAWSAEHRGESPESVLGITRASVERAALVHGIESKTAAELDWESRELRVLDRLREDVPSATRTAIVSSTVSFLHRSALKPWLEALFGSDSDVYVELERAQKRDPERLASRALFVACKERMGRRRALPSLASRDGRLRSHRDLLVSTTGRDPADLINTQLIRLCAGYLDMGMAAWTMPGRKAGFYAAFARMLDTPSLVCPDWMRGMQAEVRERSRRGATATQVVTEALETLGVAHSDRAEYLTRVLLELPGWAGMFYRIEHDPDLRAELGAPVSLMDYLAVRLSYELYAIRAVAKTECDFHGALSELPAFLMKRGPILSEVWKPAPDNDAFRLWQLMPLLGMGAVDVAALSSAECGTLLDWLDAFDPTSRRRIWQHAYEAHHFDEIMSALVHNAQLRDAQPPRPRPEAQIAFCMDDREESFRRAVEELSPNYQTFGIAGFFGMAIEWIGLDDATSFSLCPVVIEPAHQIVEIAEDGEEDLTKRRKRLRAAAYGLRYSFARGSRGFFRAALWVPLVGLLSLVPMVLSIFFPLLAERIMRALLAYFLPRPATRITGLRDEASLPDDEHKAVGFTVAETAERIETSLRNMGMTDRLAPLVLIMGHGSQSANNPHASAYDCGACGGKQGGPNARLFAESANRPEVRAILAEHGIHIPPDTWFLGGQHNTTTEDVDLFDIERVPEVQRAQLAHLRHVLAEARARVAHERCRKFESAALDLTLEEALRHVQQRAADLSQARPELGHATNAVCIVGRRSLTEGLFLDRRSFLVSYDASQDPRGEILERVVSGALPVGAGINLEYFFSRVDNDRYGCGTKLPHNVTGLVGVMDGHASDLRTGLPWQMVEIHEAVRLLVVVETTPEHVLQVAAHKPDVAQLVGGEWIRLATIDPDSHAVHVFDHASQRFVPWTPSHLLVPHVHSSLEWYRGRRDFIAPAVIDMEYAHA